MDRMRENQELNATSRLVEGLRSGERKSLEYFYEGYFGRIYQFACRRVRNAAEAEDLTQEIFLAVIRSIDSYQEHANFDSWVFGLARNLVHQHLRSAQRRQAREALAQPKAAPPTPEEELAERRVIETLSRRLATVEPWQAEAFGLRYFQRLPWTEIARRTEQTRHTVSASLRHLRGRLAIDLDLQQ
jgi:RNA polymerase sigma-70 factor (ECF subfamily)